MSFAGLLATTIAITAVLLPAVEGKALRANSGKCGALKECFLQNLDTKEEHKLEDGDTPMVYQVGPGSRFSVRCDTEGDVDQVIQTHPIAADQQEFIARVSPWWTNAGEGDWVNAVRHFSNCGPKPIQVVGYKGEDECFAEEFIIHAECEEQMCSYQCPYYSQPREGHVCLSSFDNCNCDYGYKHVGGFCVKDWCFHDYQCPDGKERILGRDCYTGKRDCKWKPRLTTNQ